MIRKHIKDHAKWLVLLSVTIFVLSMYMAEQVIRIKDNYTELWRKVSEIEMKCGR